MTSQKYVRPRVQLSLRLALGLTVACAGAGSAWAQKSDGAGPLAGGAVARVLSAGEKTKLLEEELAQESDKRVKLEEQLGLRNRENADLLATLESARKERAALEARLAAERERLGQLQKANDRLREETERVTVSVRLALPILSGIAIVMLALLVWVLLFLRQVAARVHNQRTLSEMHELEGRLIHTNDLLTAELKRSQALRHKLAELGVSD